MADGPKNGGNRGKKRSTSKFGDAKFVRYELTSDDKQRLRNTGFDADRVFDQLHALVESGYKFSVSLQSDGTAYIASLYDRDAESESVGYTLTGRGRSMSTSIQALLYKHFDLFDGVWPIQGGMDEEYG